jgi:hypothetical protein
MITSNTTRARVLRLLQGLSRAEAQALAEVIRQGMETPTQALPIDPLPIIAAELRQWSDERTRQTVHTIAMAILTTERDARARGGQATARRGKAAELERDAAVLGALAGLAPKLREHPYGRNALAAIELALSGAYSPAAIRKSLRLAPRRHGRNED